MTTLIIAYIESVLDFFYEDNTYIFFIISCLIYLFSFSIFYSVMKLLTHKPKYKKIL